ncbi:Methyltransferase type 11 [Magnetospirillum sp. LM-5]|uniref:methyltransferase domain-containing protein n=1 Tax=Magnetospirillum sp. LM-5 TaxID=2681466 RepID=UPI0013840B8D|nr:methyltransferase domain-containing protein [Magnetospirillum sp. LM-5]CAA7620280.1 Methyltransferase type 11 [Magnetospirillum sp. LM-5]
MSRKRKVADAFALAAATYDQAAEAQIRAARHLADLVAALPLAAAPDVVEVGCGTGLLTRLLKPAIGGNWLLTDLSPAMVAAAAAAIPDADHRVMDGEHPDLAPHSADLIVSNLAAQWFLDLPQAVERLAACLRPGGVLAFSTLAYGSLREWQAAHARLGLEDGVGPFPSLDALHVMLPDCRLTSQVFTVNHADGAAFLAALRAIGATVAAEGHRPLSPGSLRKVIKAMGAPAEVSYHVVHAVLSRE